MNKYLKFMAFAMTAIFSLAVVSCGEDETESNEPNNPNTPGGSSTSVQVGILEGDDAAANAAVSDLRLAETTSSYNDSYSYTYNENGNLESISNMQEGWTAWAKDNFKVVTKYDDDEDGWEEIIVMFNFSNNRITSLTFDDIYGDSDDEGEEKCTNTYTYNEKGQITSIKYTDVWCEKEEGEVYNEGVEESVMTFTYAPDYRLISMTSQATVQYNYKGIQYKNEFKETHEYEYSSERPNKFYQYTPNLFDEIDLQEYLYPFAYAGLFGKSSSYIPTGCAITGWDKLEGKEGYDWSYYRTFSCTFNSNGTISSADDYDYVYTSVGTRSFFETSEPAWRLANMEKNRRVPFHNRMRSMRERHQQLRDME